MVPGLFRPSATAAPNAFWYNDATLAGRVMRGHPTHKYVPPNTSPAAPVSRYLTDAQAASLIGAGAYGFPVSPMASTYDTNSGGAGPILTAGRLSAYSFVDPAGNLANEPSELDYDNDGDGSNEAFIMDLDFPPQQDASGKLFVPMFLVTIHDLDALINLNAHGNLSKILYGPLDISNGRATTAVQSGGGAWFGTDGADNNFYFISQSNLGLSPAEINPCWALNRRIGIDAPFAFTQHSSVFGAAPTAVTGSSLTWGETANMEFFWSKVGRYQVSPSRDLFVGVYGEPGVLYNASNAASARINSTAGGALLPRPGYSLADDNGDVMEGQAFVPYFQHPLDYTGQGSFTQAGNPKAMQFATAAGTNPSSTWIRYNKYGTSGNIRWGQAAGTMTNSLAQGLGDDSSEVAFYASDNRDADSLLSADEMLYLQLNNSEINRLNVTSRLANQMLFNFDKTQGTQSRAEIIRRHFTVASNDRKSFGFPHSTSSPRLANEYNMDTTTGTNKFPPQFGTIPRYQTTALAEDPFRPAVRYMLEIEVNQQQSVQHILRKLSVNSLLTGGATTPLAFRALTPHPDDPGTTLITTTYPPPTPSVPYPPTTPAAQEYWARRDRQQMCRDIYVLLYLLGPGADSINPTATGAYTAVQCQEMAQFAVNLVDSLDRDNVITRFEYDTDLSNGWNLDDDPYTTPGIAPSTSETDRGEVYGIERLNLSISEASVIRTGMITGNHQATPWDDATQHTFGFVELYNHSPFDIAFDDKEAWQVTVTPSGGAERRLSFKSGAGTITTGGWYSIASPEADFGGSAGKSVFKVALDGTSNIDTPSKGNWLVPSKDSPNLGLLDVATPSSVYRVEDGNVNPNDLTNTPGSWMSQVNGAMPTSSVTFKLRRRVHQTRSRMTSTDANDNDNPWVTVDQFQIPANQWGQFNLTATTDTGTMIENALNAMQGSIERQQPLDYNATATHSNSNYSGGTGSPNHSINGSTTASSGMNSNLTNYTVWQPHFDRDFASIMDLLYLPMMPPSTLTANLKDAIQTPVEQQAVPHIAAAKFLAPAPNTADSTTWNRWHRVLEFLEVPTRTNRNLGIGTDLSITRVPGRMNPNMIRYPENLAALLDDPKLFYIDMTDTSALSGVPAGSDNPPRIGDALGEGPRDWWDQFLLSRDGYDPYTFNNTSVKIPLPGLPTAAKPFRSLAHLGYNPAAGSGVPSVEDTILRSLPLDSGNTMQRRLFEVGSSNGDHAGTSGLTTKTVDPLIRNKLLAKISGNTTPRSNCFAIFVSVKYFVAVSDAANGGAIRIGGPYNGKVEPEHRGFFVVDRSKLEQGKYTGAANYDFRAFIDYRKTLATQ
jgi:hypothetical protein